MRHHERRAVANGHALAESRQWIIGQLKQAGCETQEDRFVAETPVGSIPMTNVIAKIPGTERPDEWVLRGNHRDGWVFGAWDPLSGHVAMLAEAKAIGALLKSGWKPRRTDLDDIVRDAWAATHRS